MDREDLEELHKIKKIIKRPRLQSLISAEIQKIEQPETDNNGMRNSRSFNDYDHIGRLGAGGYGSVLLAQHKLDKKYYAVKVIRISGEDASSAHKAVREVKIMARLNHINVVMYHQAWYGSFLDDMFDESEDEFNALMKSGLKETSKGKDTDVDSSNNSSVKSEDTEKTSEDGEDDKALKTEDTCRHDFICIQMQLCNGTLVDVLKFNKYQFNKDRAVSMFQQIVEGVKYLHEKRIVHNDLCPRNIFFDANKTVKIGDFGLATSLRDGLVDDEPDVVDDEPDKEGEDDSSPLIGVDTLYIPPEGRPGDEKGDIYCLGLILFELYNPFGTASERVLKLKELKSGESKWFENYPEAATLANNLMAQKLEDRPSANDLLEKYIDLL